MATGCPQDVIFAFCGWCCSVGFIEWWPPACMMSPKSPQVMSERSRSLTVKLIKRLHECDTVVVMTDLRVESKALSFPTLTYGCELWAVTEPMTVVEMSLIWGLAGLILRRMLRSSVIQEGEVNHYSSSSKGESFVWSGHLTRRPPEHF